MQVPSHLSLLLIDTPSQKESIEELLASAKTQSPFLTEIQLFHFKSLNPGLQLLREEREEIDLILLNLNAAKGEGLSSIHQLQEVTQAPIVVLVGASEEARGLEAISRGAQDYLVQGSFNGNELQHRLYQSMARWSWFQRHQQLQESENASPCSQSKFLNYLSHELKTPLNAIFGTTELLSESPLDPYQQKCVDIFKRSGESLLHLINNAMDASKIESGEITMESTVFNLQQLTEDLSKSMAVEFHKKSIELVCHLSPSVPIHLEGDPIRLQQILSSLLSNALKFTSKGHVLLMIENHPYAVEEGEAALRFSVQDTGDGLSEEQQQVILKNLANNTPSNTERKETGFGLQIANGLIQLMGGSLNIESEPGRGSHFFFDLSFQVHEAPDTPSELIEMPLAKQRILVVEPLIENQRALQEMLESFGASVKIVSDENAALNELKKAAAANNTYSILLMNNSIQHNEGWTLAESLEEDQQLVTNKIMMILSNDRRVNVQRYHEKGIDGFLTKPLSSAEVLKTINSIQK